jgi:hypothetical protein
VTVYLQKASVAELQAKGAVVRRERGDDNEARTRGHEEGGQPQVSWAVRSWGRGACDFGCRVFSSWCKRQRGASGWIFADVPLSCVPVFRWRSTRASCTSARRPRMYVILTSILTSVFKSLFSLLSVCLRGALPGRAYQCTFSLTLYVVPRCCRACWTRSCSRRARTAGWGAGWRPFALSSTPICSLHSGQRLKSTL